MEMVRDMTKGRVAVGPGTLYTLLDNFLKAGFINETKAEGRKRSYIISELGSTVLKEEYKRLMVLAEDYRKIILASEGEVHEKA